VLKDSVVEVKKPQLCIIWLVYINNACCIPSLNQLKRV